MTKRLTYVVSLAGGMLMLWFLRHSESDALVWNCAPYIVTSLLTLSLRQTEAVFSGVLAMLVVDIWLVLDLTLRLVPSMLMAISVLSTIKMFTLFPLGFAVGFAYSKKCNPERIRL